MILNMTFERFYGIIKPHKAVSFNTVKRAKITMCVLYRSVYYIIFPFDLLVEILEGYVWLKLSLWTNQSENFTVVLQKFFPFFFPIHHYCYKQCRDSHYSTKVKIKYGSKSKWRSEYKSETHWNANVHNTTFGHICIFNFNNSSKSTSFLHEFA